MFGAKLKAVDGSRILHELPGRVRILCPGVRHLGAETAEFRRRVQALSGVRSVEINPISETVLIHYDRARAGSQEVLAGLQGSLSEHSLAIYKAERAQATQTTVQERRLQEASVGEILPRVLASAVTLAFSALSGPKAPPATFLGRFTSLPALTALSLAWPILQSGVRSLRQSGRPNADTLSSTAIVSSLLAGRDRAALTIIGLADLAELLTVYTMDRTRRAIRDMLAVGEDFVWRLEDGREVRVPIEEVRIGNRIVVKTGEKISVDGVVEAGEAAVDQASITGEFMPMRKQVGDAVFAGTVVKAGHLTVRAEKVGDETAVARIVRLVEEAASRKASIQAFADRFSARFIPVNFGLAGLAYAATRKADYGLNMLIIDYSCGVRLSTATALSAAIATAARNGILIKGSNYLEMLADTDTTILDKTGTVTEGRPQVTSVVPVGPGVRERDVVELAAAAEETSTHPVAIAFVDRAARSGWAIPTHGATEVRVGRGVQTTVAGATISVGGQPYMRDLRVDLTRAEEAARHLASRGEQVLYVARNRTLLGLVGIQDTLREDMKKSLNRLRALGMDDIILLTGDVRQHAELVATKMAMDRYHAEVLPEHKSDVVLRLQQKGRRVVMVGDGINDAPALACADVGIAIGRTRTDIAMEAADITIASDDPLLIPGVIHLAQKTMGIVKQNFATAIGINTAALVLAALGKLPVVWGAAIHNATTVAVVLNSLRLLLHDPERSR
ncbi:MAG TPA: heavy metal translocating P-type ATPase [Candidatus Sulfotelmatobacter sp.]|nr:heavy metal translocating P-type ATPase [Candidatus Sulfotelmatobacter sp.]